MSSDEQLTQFFKEADTDGSNYLSKAEVKAVFQKNGYRHTDDQFEAIFKNVDSSGDGRISLDEYLGVMRQQSRPKHQAAAMRRVFQAWDKDGSGSIDRSELDQVMKELGKHFTDQELQRMVELMDADNSGTVNYEEFAKAVFGADV